MISQFHFRNWKSYQDSVLYIDPLSIIIGTNASGKSNALDALLFLQRIASGFQLTNALQGEGSHSAIRGGLEWAARKLGNDTFSITVVIRADNSTDYEYTIGGKITDKQCELEKEQLTRVKYRISKGKRRTESGRINLFITDPCQEDSPNVTARLYNEKRGSPRDFGKSSAIIHQLKNQKLRQEIEEGITIILKSLQDIFILDPIPSHMRRYSPLSDQLEPDASNIAGLLAALPENRKKEVEEVLIKYVSKLPEKDISKVYAERVGKFGSDAMLYCDEKWSNSDEDFTVDARGMTDGSLRFLAILVALLTRPKGSLLIIEEVDNGLYPSRALLLLSMLREVGDKQKVDVMVTTHNPALLDAMGTEMIPFITVAHRDISTGDSKLTLLEDIKQLPKLLAQGTIGRLSSKGLIEDSLHTGLSEEK